MKTYYIGADVHCNNTELAVEHDRKIVGRYSVATDIRSIAEVLDQIVGRKHLVFEEGPMAGWLYRNLKDKVDSLVVCEPRRNRLIASEGDKDDPIDAGKLAALRRGKYLKPVYHTEDEQRLELKRWVGLYEDRVREATRYINRIRAQGRMYGMKIPSSAMKNREACLEWLKTLNNRHLAGRLDLLWIGFEAARTQTHQAKTAMMQLARHYPIIGYWRDLPGIGLIRAVTLFAYLDTPFRFRKKSALWKYCGVGLSRQTSGKDVHGNNKATKLKLEYRCNRKLKNVIVGASRSAIGQKDNPFRSCYEGLIAVGKKPCNARHTVARQLLTVMWGMWKSGHRYRVGR